MSRGPYHWTLRPHPCGCICGCGQTFLGHPNASICPACRPHAEILRTKDYRYRMLSADPNYYRKQNAAKLAWDRARRAARPPLYCNVCRCPLPRVAGRSQKNAICAEDSRLHHQASDMARRAQRRKQSAAA